MKQFKHQPLGLILLLATGLALAGCSSANADKTASTASSAVSTSSKSSTSQRL